MFKKLEKREFESRSYNREENLEVVVTDMVMKNKLDINLRLEKMLEPVKDANLNKASDSRAKIGFAK
ncbi:45727_t:CDS:2 [Gigaspora margarita]|uniref:45727_t:CDS:1 n=1 Tax=Gigaspora margarita TaxID=4874 RepID=A0ABN7UPY8_GIGMA|nr:45727_t:CDS:2 [Gigaspora margarita]